jgi:DMSO/TMAO reductase YedYZ molybdopterin-dependent catalytic subunit
MAPNPAAKDLAARTPPGQTLTAKWPVLHYSGVPKLRLEDFELRTEGEVERPLRLSWKDLEALPRMVDTSDFHCVTTWSRLDNAWEGVSFRTIVELTGMKPSAKHVMAHSYDGYYTNVELSWLLDQDVMIAWAHDGKPLTPEHGGPVRLVVPKLYAWKSAKWLHKLEFMAQDRRGFWEERGYHNRGEPFAEERYSYQETE